MTVDDHPLFRRGVSAVVDAEPDMHVIAEANDGQEAVAMFNDFLPDVALIDLRMPVMAGVDAIRRIIATHPWARIIVLTTYQGDVEVTRAIHAGASGYILKSAVADILGTAIRTVFSGQRFIPGEIAADVAKHATDALLTARELEILQYVAAGYSNAKTAGALGISEGTVKTHMKSVFAKLGSVDRAHALSIAIERGIIALPRHA